MKYVEQVSTSMIEGFFGRYAINIDLKIGIRRD